MSKKNIKKYNKKIEKKEKKDAPVTVEFNRESHIYLDEDSLKVW